MATLPRGLLVGGYMVEKARKELPKGTLFESVKVESAKCLSQMPVQLLTPCSIGNQRLKILKSWALCSVPI